MSKRTPGPLIVDENGWICNELKSRDLNHWDETYVSFSGYFGSYGPSLFAAAPELLEVLQEILSDGMHCDFVPRLHRKAVAAIAKATGEQQK